MRPWLSIVMPTFNGARYLPQALASIEQQDLGGVEVLAIDDGSTDATPAILADFARRLPLRVLPGPRSGNWVATTNVGIAAARGELACILHQDDGFLPGRLGAVKAAVAHNPDAALWLHAVRFYDRNGRDVGPWRCPLGTERTALGSQVVLERLLVQNFIAMPAPTFRVADARRVGGLNEALWYTADWDFWLQLARLGSTAYLPRALAFFRVHDASQTVRRSRDPDALRAQMTDTFERHVVALTDPGTSRAVSRAARLSIELNVALALTIHRTPADLPRILRALRGLDLDSVRRYGRDSRLLERIGARLRARVAWPFAVS
jgi:GT2 family glycosyltransferase